MNDYGLLDRRLDRLELVGTKRELAAYLRELGYSRATYRRDYRLVRVGIIRPFPLIPENESR